MEVLNQDVGVAVMGLSVRGLIFWVTALAAVFLTAMELYARREPIKAFVSKLLSRLPKANPAIGSDPCETFNAEALDVVRLCRSLGDGDGVEAMMQLMQKHNVAAADRNCPVKTAPQINKENPPVVIR